MVSEREQSTTSAHETQAGNAAQLTASGNSKFFTPMKLELTVKLDHNNYLLWRQQIQAAIKGNRLSSFIDSTISAPNHKNLDGSVSETYLAWEQQDQMLLCWILSSISQELLPELVGCSTASEAWRTLEQLFTSQSRANVMQLKLQLQTLKKGGLSMTEYIMKKKSIIDALSFTGCVLTPDDKINAILGGLGPEYDSFVIPVTSMPNCYSLPEITALLLTHEVRIEQHTQVESLNVNLAMNKKGNNSQNGYGRVRDSKQKEYGETKVPDFDSFEEDLEDEGNKVNSVKDITDNNSRQLVEIDKSDSVTEVKTVSGEGNEENMRKEAKESLAFGEVLGDEMEGMETDVGNVTKNDNGGRLRDEVMDLAPVVDKGKELSSSPKKPSSRKWKRLAREVTNPKNLMGLSSSIRKILLAKQITKKGGCSRESSPAGKSLANKDRPQIAGNFSEVGSYRKRLILFEEMEDGKKRRMGKGDKSKIESAEPENQAR
ncbi:hypothetical protein LWI29_025645 [Acer saccharum]|uniref:Retrotransposon Copia-like N-terminal domain-containing protein n=1 Tax=Acer saccharum TaxID=4024 RepID=A0AA39S510_ACESA|nr:hypothetical protein LWI29_025645 [Acer saccharum]